MSGFIIRKLKEQYEKSSDEMAFLMGLGGVESYDLGGETWTNMIDRGGLWHVKDEAFSLFCAVEEEIRKNLPTVTFDSYSDKFQLKLKDTLSQSEDVLFYWCMLTADPDLAEHTATLIFSRTLCVLPEDMLMPRKIQKEDLTKEKSYPNNSIYHLILYISLMTVNNSCIISDKGYYSLSRDEALR